MGGVATYFWVAVGGGLGSMARFWMTGWAAGLGSAGSRGARC